MSTTRNIFYRRTDGLFASLMRMVIDALLDRLLPQFCVVCDAEGQVMCRTCIHRIDVSGVFLCPVCERSNVFGARHAGCVSPLDGVVSATRYAHLEAQALIRLCKYYFIEHAAEVMGGMVHSVIRASSLFDAQVTLVPVPLSRRRYAQRGFNQATLLARSIGDRMDIRVDESVLARRVHTQRQVDLVGNDRIQNVFNAFSVLKSPPRHVVLIDDVVTSCATLAACARVLKEAGAESVWGCTFARG